MCISLASKAKEATNNDMYPHMEILGNLLVLLNEAVLSDGEKCQKYFNSDII